MNGWLDGLMNAPWLDELNAAMLMDADAQAGCTSGMHKRDAQAGQTSGMHKPDAQVGCTSRIHKRDAEAGWVKQDGWTNDWIDGWMNAPRTDELNAAMWMAGWLDGCLGVFVGECALFLSERMCI